MSDRETLNLEEGAELVGVGLEAMRELVETGQVPAARLNKKHTVMLREDVIDFVRTLARKQAEDRRKAIERKPGRQRRGAKPDLDQYRG